MSKEVEERVVEMRFDNQQFESRAGNTINTLQKLKDALNFKSATTGIDEINKSVDKVNMNPLAAGVQSVQKSFSALEAMAYGALMNIGRKAADTGIRLVKSLSVDQIDSGFKEYELKMGSIQTIMASTGEDLDTVNGYLEELNRYADRTIYSFSDMTSNIGKFTNAGVELNQAVKAIQGISNEAAVSGANANEASRAMYNFAQALSAGYVKLIDWKSIENANMATVEFKQQLLETAEALGTVVKTENGYVSTTKDLNGKVSQAFNATRNFNDSLSHQWMTTDVLVQTLNNYSTDIRDMTVDEIKAYEAKLKSIGYTDEQIKKIEELGKKAFDAAQDVKTFSQLLDTLRESVGSGWAQTFELILGNFEQAKRMWTAVNNEIGTILQQSSDERNRIIREAFSKNNLTDVISTMTGSAAESIEQLRQLGDEVGTGSERFHEFALQVAHGDEALARLIINLIQMVDGTQSLNGWLIENTGITQDAIDEMKRLGTEYGFASEEFENYVKELANGDDELASFLQHMMDMTTNQEDTITYLAKMSGATEDYVNHLWELGRASDYSSDEFNEFAKEVTGGDEAMQKLMVSIFKATDAIAPYTDVLSYVADMAGTTRESIEELDKLGQEAGYTSEEFRKLALEISNGDEALADLITGMLTTGIQSGRDLLLSSIANIYKALKQLAGIASDAWEKVFPKITSDSLYSAIRALNEFTKRLTISDELAEKFGNTFKGLFSIVGIFYDIVKETAKFLVDAFGGGVLNVIDSTLSLTSSVGELIYNFRDWLKENQVIHNILSAIAGIISTIISLIQNWIEEFRNLEWVQDLISDITTGFTSFGEKLVSLFPRVSQRVKELFDILANLAETKDFDSLSEKLKQFGSAIKNDLTDALKKFLASFPKFNNDLKMIWKSIQTLDPGKLPSWAQKIYDAAKWALSPAIAIFGGFYKVLTDNVPGVGKLLKKLGDILGSAATYITTHLGAIAGAFLMFSAGKAIWSFANSVIEVARVVTSPMTAIKKAINGLTAAFKGIAHTFNALAFVEIVLGVVALAKVAVQLGEVETNKLWKGVGAVGVLTLLVGGVIAALGYLNSSKAKKVLAKGGETVKAPTNTMLQVVELAAAIFLVAVAFARINQAISASTAEAVKKTIEILIGAAVGMLIALGAMKFGKGNTEFKAAGTILACAFSMILIAKAFDELVQVASGINDNNFEMVRNVFLAIVGTIWGTIALLAHTDFSGSLYKTILSIGVAIRLLVSSLSAIQAIDFSTWGDNGTLKALGIIVAALAGIMWGLGHMKESSKNAAFGLLAASAAIRLLVGAVAIISTMKPSAILKGVLAVGALLIFLGAFAKLSASEYSVDPKIALVFLSLGACLVLMAAAVVLIGLLDPMMITMGVAAMSIMMLFLAGVLAASKLAEKVDYKIFLGLAALVAVLAASIVVLGLMNPDQVLVGVTAMSAIILFTTILIMAVGLLENVKVGPIIALGVIVAALAAAIYVIAQLNPANVAIATMALSEVMGMFTVMSLVLALASKMISKSGGKAIAALALMIGVIAVIGIVIGLLASLPNPAFAVLIANAMSDLMKSLSVAMVGVSMLGRLDSQGIIGGIAGMVGILLAFGTLSGVLGQLNEWMPGLQTWISNGFPLMRTLGQSIGEILGGLIEGILGTDVNGIMARLTDFGEGLSNFVDNIKGMDESAVNGVKAMVELVMAIAGADLLNAVTKWLGGDTTSLAEFGAQLVAFGPSLAMFSNVVQYVNGEAVQQAAEAAKGLAEFANNLPTSGGWKAKILGDRTSLAEFGAAIVSFAGDLVSFCDVIAGATNFDPALVTQCADAASGLVDLVNNMPETGGLKQKILGNPGDLDSFGQSLEKFGGYMKSFLSDSDGIGGITSYAAIDDVVAATEKLVDLQNILPDKESFLDSLFGGGYNLDTFGSEIKKYGIAMGDFFGAISTVTSTVETDNAISITTSLMTMAGEESMENGETLESLGSNVSNFGGYLRVFYGDIAHFDAAFMKDVIAQVKQLLAVMRSAARIEGGSLDGFSTALETLANSGIDSFLAAFEGSQSRVTASITVMLSYVTTTINSKTTEFIALGVDICTAFLDGFESCSTSAYDRGYKITTKVSEGLNKALPLITRAGEDIGTMFLKTIGNYSTDIYSSAHALGQNAINGLNNAIGNQPAQLGSNFGYGFVAYLASYNVQAYNAAWNVGRSAVNGLAEAIDAHSPSRETQKLADYAGVGFVDNLLSWISQAQSAGALVGDASLKGLSETLQRIPQMIAEDFDLSPVIRPILDLSDAEASAGYLNSMFNRSVLMSTANVASAGSYMTAAAVRTQVGGDPIVSSSQSSTAPVYINNTFNITSNNPDEVANRTSHIIQRQVERKGSTWAQSFGTAVPQTR